MGIRDLIASLGDNPYFGAGAGLFGVGATAAVSRKAFQYANIFFRRHCMMSLEVTNKDTSYPWVLTWISKHAEKSTQHLGVETSFAQTETGAIHTQYHFLPSVGDHFIRYRKTWIKVERHREIRMAGAADPWESVKLTAFGRNKNIYFELLDEARQLAVEKTQGRTPIYVVRGSQWEQFGKSPRRKRPIDSVILDENVSQKIVSDVRDFIHNSQWYHDRGIPYRRGYLLHGPPGCGKSSYITALAGELDYSISILSLGDRGMSDDRLNHMLAHAEHQSIILLEDVDAAFIGRDPTKENPSKYEGMGALTFSGLLNALDGVTSSEARILFMTTNHIDRLDPALIRPGRVDFIQQIGHCTNWQLQKMFSRFYPDAAVDEVRHFADEVAKLPYPVSPAMIQGHFMYHKHDSRAAIEGITEMTTAATTAPAPS